MIIFSQEYINDLVEQAVVKSKEHLEKNNLRDAEALLRQSLTIIPDHAKCLNMLGDLSMQVGNHEDAVANYNALLAIEPDRADVCNNLSLNFAALGNYSEAIHYTQKAIALEPEQAMFYVNLAIHYKDSKQVKQAFDILKKALKKFPDEPQLYFNYAVFRGEMGDYSQAVRYYKKAIALDPDFAIAHWNLSLTQLTLGDFKNGLSQYEWRWKQFPHFRERVERYQDKPQWYGEKVKNKRVLIYNEQGVGDFLQGLRYLPMVKNRGAHVILEAEGDMVDLMAGCVGVDEVVNSKQLPEYDLHCSLNSLPFIFKTKVESIPKIVYVRPSGKIPPVAFDAYSDKFKIGICWAGNPVHRRDKDRSCALRLFQTMHDMPGVKLFSLQKDIRKRFWPGIGVVDLTNDTQDMSVVDMSDYLKDWNYTAAIVDHMDMIITVDTGIAHLAGSMGKPCYLLLHHIPDWRWFVERDDSPWYPSLKLFRQESRGDWGSVFEAVNKCLSKTLSGKV